VNFREFLEEKVVIGHGVENAGAVSKTLLAALKVEIRIVSATILAAHGPRTWPTAVAAIVSLAAMPAGPRAKSTRRRPEDTDRQESASRQEGPGKILLRVNDFTGAVGSELPAFIGPENGDHRQAEIGPQAEPVLCSAQGRRNFAACRPMERSTALRSTMMPTLTSVVQF